MLGRPESALSAEAESREEEEDEPMAWVKTAIKWFKIRVISPKRVRIHLARSGTSADQSERIQGMRLRSEWMRGEGEGGSERADVPMLRSFSTARE